MEKNNLQISVVVDQWISKHTKSIDNLSFELNEIQIIIITRRK
jgi:hypothetical protein